MVPEASQGEADFVDLDDLGRDQYLGSQLGYYVSHIIHSTGSKGRRFVSGLHTGRLYRFGAT